LSIIYNFGTKLEPGGCLNSTLLDIAPYPLACLATCFAGLAFSSLLWLIKKDNQTANRLLNDLIKRL
jgi:hypothetical protein